MSVCSNGLVFRVLLVIYTCVYYGQSRKLLDKGNSILDLKANETIQLPRPLLFFYSYYDKIRATAEGVLSFQLAGNVSFPYRSTVFAPLFRKDLKAQVYMREIENAHDELVEISDVVQTARPVEFPYFNATWATVFTWFNVTGPSGSEKYSSFQAVFTADDLNSTFVIFLYGDGSYPSKAMVGLYGRWHEMELCISSTNETANLANLRPCNGTKGTFVFQIDMESEKVRDSCIPTVSGAEDPPTTCECSKAVLPKGLIMVDEEDQIITDTVKLDTTVLTGCDEDYAKLFCGPPMPMTCSYNGNQSKWRRMDNGDLDICALRPTWESPAEEKYSNVTIKKSDKPGKQLLLTLSAKIGSAKNPNISYFIVSQTPSIPWLFNILGDHLVLASDPGDVTTTEYILELSAKDMDLPDYDVQSTSFVLVHIFGTTPARTLALGGIVGIIIGLLAIAGIVVGLFLYKRYFWKKVPSLAASFSPATATAELGIRNPNYRLDSTNSTNDFQPGVQHRDTEVLTTGSWLREQERMRSEQ